MFADYAPEESTWLFQTETANQAVEECVAMLGKFYGIKDEDIAHYNAKPVLYLPFSVFAWAIWIQQF